MALNVTAQYQPCHGTSASSTSPPISLHFLCLLLSSIFIHCMASLTSSHHSYGLLVLQDIFEINKSSDNHPRESCRFGHRKIAVALLFLSYTFSLSNIITFSSVSPSYAMIHLYLSTMLSENSLASIGGQQVWTVAVKQKNI